MVSYLAMVPIIGSGVAEPTIGVWGKSGLLGKFGEAWRIGFDSKLTEYTTKMAGRASVVPLYPISAQGDWSESIQIADKHQGTPAIAASQQSQ